MVLGLETQGLNIEYPVLVNITGAIFAVQITQQPPAALPIFVGVGEATLRQTSRFFQYRKSAVRFSGAR